MAELPVIRVTEVGEFIRYKSCERRFKLGFKNRALAQKLPFVGNLFSPLDPVLQASGRKREEEWEVCLRDTLSFKDLSTRDDEGKLSAIPWQDFYERATKLKVGENAYAREVHVSQAVGAFQVEGRIDFVLFHWQINPDDGTLAPRLRLVECKASRKDRTYHRAQLALYKLMVLPKLQGGLAIADHPLTAQSLECVVARIDETTNQGQQILDLPPFDLDSIEFDIARLLAPGGTLTRTLAADLDSLPYQLEAKCDDCMFSIHCLPESGRQRRLELLGCDPSTIRALKKVGIETLDEMSALDPHGQTAAALRSSAHFSDDPSALKARATARLSTLPQAPEGAYNVQQIDTTTPTQLPPYNINGEPLVRVFLSVDYDYTENRLIALSAHVTDSDWQLHTGWTQTASGSKPDPQVHERRKLSAAEGEKPTYEERPLSGMDIACIKDTPWTGIYDQDTEAERELIEDFLIKLITAIARTALQSNPTRVAAPMHFYVWERAELSYLVEGCARTDSLLLSHLRELLGCREPLEQLIYSCLRTEVDSRFALGWTGRGLSVITSLRWFGNSFHWTRNINESPVRLDSAFAEDIFDFNWSLAIDEHGNWLEQDSNDPNARKHKFELRSRFRDSLPAPYWHAYWGILPRGANVPKREASLAKALDRYHAAISKGSLETYLTARTQALRWVEERMVRKNYKLAKTPMQLLDVPQFSLGVRNIARAALDCLRIDHHVRHNDWIQEHLQPPNSRISAGRMIPVRNLRCPTDNRLTGQIDCTGYDLTLDDLKARCTFGAGDFVRLIECTADPSAAQSLEQMLWKGSTCIIKELNWQTGEIVLSVIPKHKSDLYKWKSRSWEEGELSFRYATIDESPSEFVSARVDKHLLEATNSRAVQWFDPLDPAIPPSLPVDPEVLQLCETFLDEQLPALGTFPLAPDQKDAVLRGLQTRLQLLQGPPGTGKTMTTAAAVLARILASRGAGVLMLLSASTHTALDTLLERLGPLINSINSGTADARFKFPPIKLLKAASSEDDLQDQTTITKIKADANLAKRIASDRQHHLLVVGGTTSSLLKLAEADPLMRADSLIVDEASMLVFPHFLSLATLVSKDGTFMLAGDHRQLSPILAHDWENEDRPPAVLYQPYVSAYDAVRTMGTRLAPQQVDCCALQYTFRLPDAIRRLIARLYARDEVNLQGRPDGNVAQTPPSNRVLDPGAGVELSAPQTVLSRIWGESSGLFLLSHNDRESKRNNELEVRLIEQLLSAPTAEKRPGSIAVVTPHRAQRTLLQTRLAQFAPAVDIIDTVERLQGGERSTVIYSATVSDPAAIAANVEFILDLNRSNVAFSRAIDRLIVVCSRHLMDFIPADLDQYDETLLWKALRQQCSTPLGKFMIDEHEVLLTR